MSEPEKNDSVKDEVEENTEASAAEPSVRQLICDSSDDHTLCDCCNLSPCDYLGFTQADWQSLLLGLIDCLKFAHHTADITNMRLLKDSSADK